jgi:hypothetical protein
MMWSWINRNGQGLSALFAAFAVAGILYQVHASEQAQRAQSARNIYREFVALTISRPELALTEWSDALPPERKIAYEAYVEYLLYTSEQVIAADEDWSGPMKAWLCDHTAFLASRRILSGYTMEVQRLIKGVNDGGCRD